MNLKPEHAKEYWKLNFAYISFRKARDYFELLKTTDQNTSTYDAIFEAAVVNYGRAFKKVRFSEKRKEDEELYKLGIIPEELKKHHEDIMTLRDKAVAHTDAQARPDEVEHQNALYVTIKEGRKIDFEFYDLGNIKAGHEDKLIELCDWHIKNLFSKMQWFDRIHLVSLNLLNNPKGHYQFIIGDKVTLIPVPTA